MSDDGSILIGRSGSFFTGFTGVLWIEQVGWMTFDQFFHGQGVVEAANTPFSNPISINGNGTVVTRRHGRRLVLLDRRHEAVFVCENGKSVATDFPQGLREKVATGAQLGRCRYLKD